MAGTTRSSRCIDAPPERVYRLLIDRDAVQRWKAAFLFLLAVSSPALSAEDCPITEQALAGAWGNHGDSGFFEEFLLEIDAGKRTFSSWLHQRPELSGAAWQVENCRLVITPRRGEFPPFRFRILGLEQDRLRLYDESDRIESVYVRAPDGS